MRITVTAQHIERGHRGLCTSCPVAIALAQAMPGSDPSVTLKITIRRHGRTVAFELPAAVLDFVTAFDRGDRVRPFTFELPLPDEPSPEPNTAAAAA